VSAALASALSALGTFAYVSAGWLVFFLPLDRALAVAGRAAEALTHPDGLALLAALALVYTAVRELSRSGWNGAALWSGTPVPLRGLVYALVTLGAVVQMADPATTGTVAAQRRTGRSNSCRSSSTSSRR